MSTEAETEENARQAIARWIEGGPRREAKIHLLSLTQENRGAKVSAVVLVLEAQAWVERPKAWEERPTEHASKGHASASTTIRAEGETLAHCWSMAGELFQLLERRSSAG